MADVKELSAEIRQWLVDHVANFIEAEDLDPILVWEELPDESAFLNQTLQFPALAVMSDGLSDAPERNGRKSYKATWRFLVQVWVEAEREQEDAIRKTRDYTKAVRNCLLSAQRLNWTWVGERYAGIDDSRLSGLMGTGTIEMDVLSDIDTSNLNPGPVNPVPIVREVLLTVDLKEELN